MQLLSLLQLTDSAFPGGRYTLSHGLESFAQSGWRGDLLTMLSDTLRCGVAPSDGVAVACAHRAVRRDGSLDRDLARRTDERLTAVKLPREAREASLRTGRALLSAAMSAFAAPPPLQSCTPGNHAVVFGVLCGWLQVPCRDAVAGELYAWSSSWVSAAVRLGLIDHQAAQMLLHEVRPVTARAALQAVEADVGDISSCTPLVDVMSMRHEGAALRLFAT